MSDPAPWVAAGAALLLAAAFVVPGLMPVAAVAASLAVAALALRRRNGRGLRIALAAIAAWQLVALAGAWWLRDAGATSLVFVLAAGYLLPLPLIPWLYARTFDAGDGDAR